MMRYSHSQFGKSIKLTDQVDDNLLTKQNLANELDDYLLEDLYELLVRNGFYLPSKTCHWLTKKVMIGMVLGNTYCPSFNDIRPLPCPRPPVRLELIQEINKEIEKQMSATLKLQFTNSRMPDLQWLIFTLAALNPKHKYFSKSYYPTKANDPQMIIKLEQLKNNGQLQHSFF